MGGLLPEVARNPLHTALYFAHGTFTRHNNFHTVLALCACSFSTPYINNRIVTKKQQLDNSLSSPTPPLLPYLLPCRLPPSRLLPSRLPPSPSRQPPSLLSPSRLSQSCHPLLRSPSLPVHLLLRTGNDPFQRISKLTISTTF